MGWEHEPETVWRAQEMYCVDRLSFDKVAEQTGIASSTLKRWSEKYRWREKRDEIALAESEIRADFVRARSGMLKKLIADQGAQDAFAVASLENLALAKEKAVQAGAEERARRAVPLREIRTAEDAVCALSEAVEAKLNMMLGDPGTVDFKAIKELRQAMEMIAGMRAQTGSKEEQAKAKGLSVESADAFRKQILGIQ
jgi:hypothetical protein